MRRAAVVFLRVVCAGLLAAWFASASAFAAAAESYAEEDVSFGIEPPPGYRAKDYHARTPDHVPGARVVTTIELRDMLAESERPFLLDVLSGPAHPTLPGAIWLHNGGLGDFDAEEEKRFLEVLARISGHDKGRALVFFCSGARCWLSYNAALRATRAGYSKVYWYRGGVDAWRAAGLPTHTTTNFQW